MKKMSLIGAKKQTLVIGFCALLVASSVLSTQVLSQQKSINQLPAFNQLVKQNVDAVVSVRGSRSKAFTQKTPEQVPEQFRRFFGEDFFNKRFFEQAPQNSQPMAAQGSGFIISADGYVLTNAHVIDGSKDIVVRLNDRREFPATLVGNDKRSDVALLKINADNLPTVAIGNSSDLEVGDWLLAIGSPFGLDYSASQGIVSALGRSLPDGAYVPFIQTDVAVNPGNSGGPLFDLEGRVIGINSQIYSRSGGYQGVSFAIPINLAMNVVDQLKDKGFVSRGWLGVTIQDVSQLLAESFKLEKPVGALVSQVSAESPAANAGIQVGDVIVSFAGTTIDRSAELPPLVGVAGVGNEVTVELMREGKRQSIKIEIGELEKSNDPQRLAKLEEPEEHKLGVAVSDLDEQTRKDLAVDYGVIIGEVIPGSPAEQAGLKAGDVILSLNQQAISDAEQLVQLVQQSATDKPAIILIKREQGTFFVPVNMS